MSATSTDAATDDRYDTKELVRRLTALAWRFRGDCLWSVGLSLALLLLGLAGLALLGEVIDVIRHAPRSNRNLRRNIPLAGSRPLAGRRSRL